MRAGNGIFAIATLAIYTRLLSPAEYGVYALGMAIATLTSGILFEWLNVAVGRFYPMYLDDSGKIMDVAALGFWAAASVAALLFLGALLFHEVLSVEPALFGILLLITVALGRHTLALQVANTQSAPFRYGGLSWAKSGGALLVGFILIHYGYGGRGALLGFLSGLVFAVTVFAPRPWMRLRVASVDKSLSVELFRYGLPLTLNHFAVAVVDLADRLMIGSMLGVAHVAPYAVAYDLVQQSVGPMMNVLFLAAFPVIVQVFNVKADETARFRLHALGSRLIAVGLPATVGLGILSRDISEIIFGSGYSQNAAAIMPWLAAAIFVGAFKSYFLDVVFLLRQATNYLGYIAILMAAVNIFLNLLLLPRYGVIAAAWTTLAAFSVGAFASWVVGKSIFLLPAVGNVFWRSTLASATMAIILYLLPSSSGIIGLSAKLALGTVTYGVMAWALDVAGCRSSLKI